MQWPNGGVYFKRFFTPIQPLHKKETGNFFTWTRNGWIGIFSYTAPIYTNPQKEKGWIGVLDR